MIKTRDIITIIALLALFSGTFAYATIDPAAQLIDGRYASDTVAPRDVPLSEMINERKPPLRYRIVGPTLIWSVWQVTGLDRLTVDVGLRWLTTATMIGLFYTLLRRDLDIEWGWAALGGLALVAAFPLVFAYDAEIMSRLDDMLNYLFVIVGLRLVLHQRYAWFVLVTVLAALSRETGLVLILVLPFVTDLGWGRRILYGGPAFIAALIPRLLTPRTGYLFVGWEMNVGRIPLYDSLAYAFVAHGVLWLTAAVGWGLLLRDRARLTRPQRLIVYSAGLCVPAIVFTSTMLGALRENRLLFLAFPWVIAVSVLAAQRYIPPLLAHTGYRTRLKWLAIGAAVSLVVVVGGFLILDALVDVTPYGLPLVEPLYTVWVKIRDESMTRLQWGYLTGQALLTVGVVALMVASVRLGQ